MLEIGIATALVASIFWGSISVPMKVAKNVDIMWYQLISAIGTLIATIIMVPIAGLSFEINLIGISSGLIWAIANTLAISSIIKIGMSRAVPLFTGTSILLSSSWGILYFKEPLMHFEIALLGLSLLILGIITVNTTKGQYTEKWLRKGAIFAVVAGLLLGTQFVPMQISGLTTETIFFPMALGIAIGATAIFLIKGRQRILNHIPHGLTSGGIFAIGNYFGIITISTLGLTIGFAITQVAVLVAILWGLLYFKEMTQKINIIKILIAATFILSGAFLLALSI